MMRTTKDIGFFTKLILIFLTKLQEISLKSNDSDLYMRFTKLHFRLFFKKNLFDEFLNDSPEFKTAQERHGRMVVAMLFPDSHKRRKLQLKNNAKESFAKDLALDIKL